MISNGQAILAAGGSSPGRGRRDNHSSQLSGGDITDYSKNSRTPQLKKPLAIGGLNSSSAKDLDDWALLARLQDFKAN